MVVYGQREPSKDEPIPDQGAAFAKLARPTTKNGTQAVEEALNAQDDDEVELDKKPVGKKAMMAMETGMKTQDDDEAGAKSMTENMEKKKGKGRCTCTACCHLNQNKSL
jgi:hypothetical protein